MILGEKDDLYTELWLACAGSHVYVPRVGEKVFYFPQGHIEQVEAYTDQDGMMEMPIYNLSSKILCKVVYVQLKANSQTDEVFAQVTLLPVAEQDDISSEDENAVSSPQRASVCSFVKRLTPSDTSTHGGFSVPKQQAVECFPPLNMSQEPPVQGLVAQDLQGFKWHFRHIYRGQPRRHLLTSGWSSFVTAKKLVAGDACIFLRGENGQLCVGLRRAMKQLNNVATSVISRHSMQHGILASAFHAVTSGTMFTVYYHPWTSPSKFIIPYTKLNRSVYSVGTRFRMQSDGEECSEKRPTGTVVGIEDIDCIRWPGSEWRCLQVQWDSTSDTFLHPERVSPWNIELIESTNKKKKRTRPLDPALPGFSSRTKDGLFQSPVECTPPRHTKVLQGQENRKIVAQELGAQTSAIFPHLIYRHLGLENQLCHSTHDHLYRLSSNIIPSPAGNMAAPFTTYRRPQIITTSAVCDNDTVSRNISVSNITTSNTGSQECRASESRDENEAPHSQPTGRTRYMLFGVNLVNSHLELPSPQVANYCELCSPCSFSPTSHSSVSETIQVSEPSKDISGILLEKQCENCSVTSRSCTKVLKYGTALGRSVDLMRFDGYDELISELDQMFDFQGSLIYRTSGWHVTFTDGEGLMMLIGDISWQKFCLMVRRIFICPKEEIDKPIHEIGI
ncbi:hypothetical protein FH972_006036 [Carpinus fangiana]|uniref:Auxin response factor n=1 Tax=Carpinus fangiana TaxID=176857 RepID=A0A5N6QSW6_9ROSI|nr:hypothetical protein FH972_006036 [Carpinus fangiana]